MKASTRGAIRKGPNAISWVYSIINLSGGKAVDPGNLIKQWTLGLIPWPVLLAIWHLEIHVT